MGPLVGIWCILGMYWCPESPSKDSVMSFTIVSGGSNGSFQESGGPFWESLQ